MQNAKWTGFLPAVYTIGALLLAALAHHPQPAAAPLACLYLGVRDYRRSRVVYLLNHLPFVLFANKSIDIFK